MSDSDARAEKPAKKVISPAEPSRQESAAGSAKRKTGKRTVSAAVAIATILGGIAALISILQFGQQATQSKSHSAALSPMLSEEHMISLLIAGDNYIRLQQIIGAEPDMQRTFKSGNTLYQFDRPWEYIDLLVSAGRVLSVGVYAETTAFKATLNDGGVPITVNVSKLGGPGATVGATGNCGGNIGASFFEGFTGAMANGQSSLVLGWVNSRTMTIPQPACAAVFPLNRCSKLDNFTSLSLGFLECLNSSKIGQEIGQLSLNPPRE